MRYFYDTEFIEDGTTIELVSIGVKAGQDGREYYAVSTEFDLVRAATGYANVLPKLPSPSSSLWRDRRRIRDDLYEFFTAADDVELWAWVGAYDHVVLCQLWGPMTALPRETSALHARIASALGGGRTSVTAAVAARRA